MSRGDSDGCRLTGHTALAPHSTPQLQSGAPLPSNPSGWPFCLQVPLWGPALFSADLTLPRVSTCPNHHIQPGCPWKTQQPTHCPGPRDAPSAHTCPRPASLAQVMVLCSIHTKIPGLASPAMSTLWARPAAPQHRPGSGPWLLPSGL